MISKFDKQLFIQMPIVGILRNISYDDVMRILPIYAEAGLNTLEITMNTPNAVQIIRDSVDSYGDKLNIGAGTVCCIEDFETAVSAGAQFIVSPNVDEKVIEACKLKHIPVFPGAFTATEIYRAWRMGANMVKVFPAGALGVRYFKDISAPIGHIPLMATGGIGLQEIPLYYSVGVSAFGIGSPLFPFDKIVAKDWEGLKQHFEKFVQAVKENQLKEKGNG